MAASDEFELLDAFVTSVEGALERIDEREKGLEPLPPGEQLAVLAVGVVRGCLPMLRDERDRQRAELNGGQEAGRG